MILRLYSRTFVLTILYHFGCFPKNPWYNWDRDANKEVMI